MYPASTATILRLFYNNTADVTHDTLWMWDEVRDYQMGGVASSSLPPDPFHSQPALNTAACGLYSAAAPAPMWVFLELRLWRWMEPGGVTTAGRRAGEGVTRGTWQHGSRALHVSMSRESSQSVAGAGAVSTNS